MKQKIYLRVGYDKKRRRSTAQLTVAKPSSLALVIGNDHVPTVGFALMIEIPDAAFDRAGEVIAEIKIPNPEIAAEVKRVGM